MNWTGTDHALPHGSLSSWLEPFPEFERCLNYISQKSKRPASQKMGPGLVGRWCGDGSEFVYEGKREEAVEPPAFSLGCGPSHSYTEAVKRKRE